MKKLLCAFLALILIFGFTACGTGGSTSSNENSSLESEQLSDADNTQTADESETENVTAVIKNTVLTLPYNLSDGLDPFNVKSEMNREICSLIYDPLYKIDSEFSPVAVLSKESDVSGMSVKVTIEKNVKFSDSTSLNASDVVYSFNTAKQSGNYSEQLKNFTSAYAENNHTVVFKLEKSDVWALSCLTFPIVKSSSATGTKAVGSGRYYLSGDKLKANKNHVSGEGASFSEISLYNIKSSDVLFTTVQIGAINFAFSDLSDCQAERVSANTKTVPLNNLVYIGMKTSKGLLKDANLRNIISLAVNRADIVASAFNSYATASKTPFNPLWKDTPTVSEKEYTAQEIAELLDNNGYAYRNDTDTHRKNDAGNELILTLAVNKNNAFKLETAKCIKSDLQLVGIEVNIVELNQKELKKAAKNGKYDMYIGEIKLSENMSLSPFFSENGAASYLINKDLNCISSYNNLVSGKIKIDEFVTAFDADTPFVPLCYRMGIVAVSNSLEDNTKPCAGDLYSNIYEWKFVS